MLILDAHVLWLILATFGTAWFSSIVGMGGGIILLAVLTVLVPIEILIPLHALLLIGNTASRAVVMRRYIDWHLLLKFMPGILIGVIIGAQMNLNLPQDIFMILLSLLMLLIVWMPKKEIAFNVPHALTGIGHGLISTSFGSGGLIQAVFVRLNLSRHAKIATFTAIMLGLNTAKLGAFTAFGVDLSPFLLTALLCLPGAIIGSILGKRCLDLLPEAWFKIGFKLIVSALALRLLLLGLDSFYGFS